MRKILGAQLVVLALLFHVTLGHAQGLMTLGAGSVKAAAASGGSFTTLNLADKSASLSLSGGNLTATVTTVTGSVRSIASHSTGKFYFEITFSSGALAYNHAIALANSSAVLGNGPGSPDTNSLALYMGDPAIYSGGASVGASGVTIGAGDTVGMAVDIGAGLVWVRDNGGNWNGSPTNNPATGVGGIAFTLSGPLFAYDFISSAAGAGGVNTANFGATAYGTSAPAGFGNW